MGVAGSLLIFTGVWHALEWLMGGRNRDTLRLIPVGIVYILLGYLIVTFQGGTLVAWIALIVTAVGMSAAFTLRHALQIRPWVTWAFILIDLVIIAGLLMGLLG